MAFTFISTDQTTTETFTGPDDTLVVKEDIFLAVDGGDAVDATSGDDKTIVVYGNILSDIDEGTGGIGINLGGESNSVLITDTGSIVTDGSGILSTGDNLNVTNNGVMASSGMSSVISSTGDGAFITNTGVMEAGRSTLFGGELRKTIFVEGADNTVYNSGTLTGGVQFQNNGAYGVNYLINDGTIVESGGGVAAFDNGLDMLNTGLVGGGVSLQDGAHEITNTGVIGASAGTGIAVYYAAYGFAGTDEGLVINNTGLIDGDVRSSDSNEDSSESDTDDVFNGFGGTVNGIITLGGGDDLVKVDQDELDVDGGIGTDTLIVSATLGNVSGFETVRMIGTGDFSIRTDNTDTAINGNAGNNVLEGRGGEDTIRGGLGNDEIIGGNGKDILIGGTGEDVFIYDTAAESTVADSDRIRDLKRGEDVIDLSDVVTDAVFLGTGGFTTSGFSEVRYQVTGGVNARVEVDVDGDGSADMRMILTGNNLLDADDFIL